MFIYKELDSSAPVVTSRSCHVNGSSSELRKLIMVDDKFDIDPCYVIL